jgi:hypothetical protein
VCDGSNAFVVFDDLLLMLCLLQPALCLSDAISDVVIVVAGFFRQGKDVRGIFNVVPEFCINGYDGQETINLTLGVSIVDWDGFEAMVWVSC